MGQDVDATLNELDATRASLERDIDALVARLPDPEAVRAKATTYGAAAAGTAVTVGLVAVRARKRSELKARRTEARINAEELARAFSPHAPPAPSGRSPLTLLVVLAAIAGAVVAALRLKGSDDDAAESADVVSDGSSAVDVGAVETGAASVGSTATD